MASLTREPDAGRQRDVWAGGPVERSGIRCGGWPAGTGWRWAERALAVREVLRLVAGELLCPPGTLRLGAGGGQEALGFP